MSLVTQLTAAFQAVALALKTTRVWAQEAQFPSNVPGLDTYIMAPGMLSTANTAFTATWLNRQYNYPHIVPYGFVCSGPVFSIGTAASGGAGLTLRIGLYGTDPLTGLPDLVTGPLRTYTNTDFTATVKSVNWTEGDITLVSGKKYWIGVIFTYTTVPTTFPTTMMLSNTAWHTGFQAKTTAPGIIRSLYIVSQSTLRNTALALNLWVGSGNTDAPAIGLRRSTTL